MVFLSAIGIAKRASCVFFLLGMFGWEGGVNAACEPSPSERSQLKEGYFHLEAPLNKTIEHLGEFKIDGAYSGALIQSMAFDSVSCKWLAAVSTGRKPELITILVFPPKAPYLSEQASRTSMNFSHPQDLSLSVKGGQAEIWLPDSKRKGVNRFEMDEDGSLVNIRNYRLSKNPVKGYFSAVSVDGNYLVTMGAVGKGGSSRQEVNVYRVSDLADLPDHGGVLPIYSWPLNEIQQDKAQWRQGLAVIGSTVFVLSGNAKRDQPKFIVSYKLEGGAIAVEELPGANSNQLMTGRIRTYEPEGLEVIRHNGGLALALGMAGGTKGQRSFDMWVVPLRK